MQNFFNQPRLAGRLDLASEATALLRGAANIEIAGISEEVEHRDQATIHSICVLNEQGSRAINKPLGHYITIELPPLNNSDAFADTAALVAEKLKQLLPPLDNGLLLIVGLGNNCTIADALGPRVIERSYATRQLFSTDQQPEGLGRVCLNAPGVEGTSGIASSDLICSLCQRLQPDAVIAVDSLAASSIRRVGTTIQISDSGIRPGSGVGQKLALLNAECLGCPVAAIGVPTIVNGAAIISETLAALAENWSQRSLILPPELDDQAREYAEKRLLSVFKGQLMVTPKDIDELIENQAEIIAAACAIYAHPGCSADNYHNFLR